MWGVLGRFDRAVTLTIFFFFQSSMLWMTKKNDTYFQIFLKISLAAVVEIIVE